MILAGSLPTAFIDMGGENLVTITVAPPQGGSSAAVCEKTVEAEDILEATRRRRDGHVDHPRRFRHRHAGAAGEPSRGARPTAP